MKKILIGFLGILVVAVAAALIAPSFIDWNAYRGEITAEVRKATGRTLAIDGGIDVALLPAPKLRLTKARLSNVKGAADPDMVRLAALDLRIALWPLLSGKIVVRSVELRGADIRLEKLADGSDNWTFAASRQTPPGGGNAGSGRGQGGSRTGDSVSLQQVIIKSGALSYRDSVKGTVQRMDHINARIAAATLSGPFVARGEFRYSGEPIGFELHSGRIEQGASTDVSLAVRLIQAKAKVDYSGVITPGAPGFTATGKLKAQGPDLGALLAALGRAAGGEAANSSKTPSAPAKPFSVTAGVSGGADSFSIDDITADLGGSRASGAFKVALGNATNIDGTFKIGRLDLDSWLAGANSASAGATGAGSATGAHGAKAGKGSFSLPRDLNIALDAGIDGIVFRKQLVRDLHARIQMEKGRLTIRRLSARLPGDTETKVSGRLEASKGSPRFEGQVRLDSSDFRAVVRWLGGDDGALPPDRLRKVDFRASLGLTPERVELSDIDMRFDSSKVTGGMVVALRERIGIGARLEVDRLNLDAYLPKATASTSAAAGPAGKKPPAAAGGMAALAAFDANLNITARRLTYGGERIDGMTMDATLMGGDLTLRNLTIAGLAGARVEAKGIVRNLGKTPIPDVTVRLSAKDPRRLFRLAPFQVPDAVGDLGPLKVDGRLTAEPARTRFDLDASLGKVKLGAKGTVAGLGTAPHADLDFRLRHPDFVTFVRLFDPGFKPEKPARGPFSVSAKIAGAGLDLKLDKFAAQLGQEKFTGAATLSLAAARPLLKADLRSDEIIADHFLAGPGPQAKNARAKKKRSAPAAAGGPPWSDEPIDVEMLKVIDADVRIRAGAIVWRRWRVADPRLDLTLDNGRLDLRRLTGDIVGGNFHMTGSVAAPAKPGGVLRTRLDLDVARMDLHQAMFNAADVDIAKGKVNFKMTLSGAGASSRAIARSLAGSGSLAATEGEVSGFDLARVNDRIKRLNDAVSLITLMQTAMAGGTTRFSRLSGTFAVKDGVLRSNDISIVADGGTGAGKLKVDIGRWLMDGDLQFRLSGNAEAPPFDLQMKGPLDAPRRIIKANALEAWLANRAAGALVNRFMGQPKQGGGTAGSGSQPQPSSKEQFIKGIFDILRK